MKSFVQFIPVGMVGECNEPRYEADTQAVMRNNYIFDDVRWKPMIFSSKPKNKQKAQWKRELQRR